MYLLPPQSPLIASEPLAKGIQDNSFFIEEAYKQEPGVVQHILQLCQSISPMAPSVRYVFRPNDAQLVIGAALPIGLT